MWRSFQLKNIKRHNFRLLYIGAAIFALFVLNMPSTSADLLQERATYLSSSELSATAEYRINFRFPSPSAYGSLAIQVCSNDPFPTRPCTTPPGFDLSGATLSAQTGATGFSIMPGSTSNRMVLTRTPAAAGAIPVSYNLQNIVNPSTPGSYYVRLLSYASDDATGPYTYEGGSVFAIINTVSVKATVPPYLIFCTGITIQNLDCAESSGDYIDFGEFSSRRTSSGSSQMIAATNAQSGYNISVDGTTMTSGTNEVPAILTNDVSRPGTGQFGLNLATNSTPAGGAPPSGPGVAVPVASYTQPNLYRFVDGQTLVTWPVPDDMRLYTVSYIVNVPSNQAPGIYVTTLTYVCLGTF